MTYSISLQRVAPRPFAAIRQSMRLREVPSRFRQFLDQVYAAAKGNAIALDGQNIFVYRAGPSDLVEVEFGVGAKSPFATIGNVTYSAVPGGDVATTTHWGDYGGLGAAHEAVVTWCWAAPHTLAGISWEVYGHWHDDPAKRRTDIYHLLQRAE